VFGTLARNNEKGTGQLLKIFENSEQAEVQRNALIASAQTNDLEVLKNVFDYGVSD
jgi:hypothetical protein